MVLEILCYLFLINSDCREDYINKVLQSKDNNKYFVVAKVSVEGVAQNIIVINTRLRNHLQSVDVRFSDSLYYTSVMRQNIDEKIHLNFAKADLEKMDACYVHDDAAVTSVASRGNTYFINYYFDVAPKGNYAKLKQNVADEWVPQILQYLFDWNYFTGIVENQITILNMKPCNSN